MVVIVVELYTYFPHVYSSFEVAELTVYDFQ